MWRSTRFGRTLCLRQGLVASVQGLQLARPMVSLHADKTMSSGTCARLGPLMFADTGQQAKATRDPVAPAQRSKTAKVARRALDNGTPVHSFSTLMVKAIATSPFDIPLESIDPRNGSCPYAGSAGGGVGRAVGPTIRWQM
jgi:hypothetical protein